MQQILIEVKPSSSLSWAWPSSAPACSFYGEKIQLKFAELLPLYTFDQWESSLYQLQDGTTYHHLIVLIE